MPCTLRRFSAPSFTLIVVAVSSSLVLHVRFGYIHDFVLVVLTQGLVEVHIDALQLQIGIPVVRAGRVDPMLVRSPPRTEKYA